MNKREINDIFSSKKDMLEGKLEDFKKIKLIVEYIHTKELYAMKCIRKDVIIEWSQIEKTFLEKKILESLDHNFLIGSVFFFQSIERIYFVMPFMRGGELKKHMEICKTFDEDRVRFYSAQISLALDYLHSFGIVYRDLKPNNILMDQDGYLKLSDFGFARLLKEGDKAMSFYGLSKYSSPENLSGEGCNKAEDYWILGILIYEMLCGKPPFYNDNHDIMYKLITSSEISFPEEIKISEEAKDLISKLLDKNVETRFGVKDGIKEFKLHPFFKKLDFENLLQKKLIPPFKPEITSCIDLRYFLKELIEKSCDESLISDNNLDLIKDNNYKFKDF